MKIDFLGIKNYKSLRDVQISPSDFTVLIGPNGSGKSNIASAFDFIGDVYQNGLEYAVAKKGGYENIAFRKIRRTKSPVEFFVRAIVVGRLLRRFFTHQAFRRMTPGVRPRSRLEVNHHFKFRAARQSVGAEYVLESESLEMVFRGVDFKSDLFSPSDDYVLCKLIREDNLIKVTSNHAVLRENLEKFLEIYNDFQAESDLYELFAKQLFPQLAALMGAIAVHQFSPQISRGSGAPSPNPRLSGYGQNLPSLVDWLQRRHKDAWVTVESAMRDIIPDLEEITVGYLHTKQLGLFFKESSFGRAWAAEDVSDGTIQTLAILSALADPRNSLMFIEEPENSVHPWIVRQIAAVLRKLSKTSQIIVTTHSPLILNAVDPKSVLVCFKRNGATHVKPLVELDPDLLLNWESGVDRLFDMLDTGCIVEAVPLPGGEQ
ncbi:AAA family ATPase [Ferribacterium limneticum]|uniref:AAA family ATPase n=1 Tax=Ferribacterium limneticum TaxID=76259 RepID=UPI001CFA1098|nr:AAA family ATPase [Ferribacterium limneticum]UCV20075.1 AAA family ATPase [Ferribacterium limneticum]